jgi:hypothetical protein
MFGCFRRPARRNASRCGGSSERDEDDDDRAPLSSAAAPALAADAPASFASLPHALVANILARVPVDTRLRLRRRASGSFWTPRA